MKKSTTIFVLVCIISVLIFTGFGCKAKEAKISADNPLPDEAFKAEIAVVDQRASLKMNSTSTVKVKVKNLSKTTWPSKQEKYSINLAYHWLDKSGKVIVHDGERTPLPNNLGPDKEVVLDANVKTPDQAGEYICEFDMVQESVAWFKDRGSNTAKINVKVE